MGCPVPARECLENCTGPPELQKRAARLICPFGAACSALAPSGLRAVIKWLRMAVIAFLGPSCRVRRVLARRPGGGVRGARTTRGNLAYRAATLLAACLWLAAASRLRRRHPPPGFARLPLRRPRSRRPSGNDVCR